MSSRLSVKSLLYVTPLAAACVLATGCSNMVNSASSSPLVSANSAMTGQIHGGNQPVSNSDVRLFSVGTTGYGTAGIQYASTTTDSNGFFSFNKVTGAGATAYATYGCPTNGADPQMYISAKGGNTQGAGNGNNTAAAFIVAIGKCSTLSSSTIVTMNELTTAATLAALQQYFSPANANSDNLPHFGYPNSTQAQTGFANGLSILGNLVNVAAGTTAATTVTANGLTVTITPEIAKLNTIANIGAACVNTTSASSSACTTLFQSATPPTAANTSQPGSNFSTAQTTVGAIWNMLTNPTSGSSANLNALFNLTNAQAPFQPMEATAPTDWTVGLRYASTSPCASGTANFLSYAYHVAIDAAGNMWAISNATGGNLFELSPNGTPLTCTGGFVTGKGSALTIDINGNIWFGGNTTGGGSYTAVFKYTPSTASFTSYSTGLPNTTGIAALSTDRLGDIFVTGTGGNSVYVIPPGANNAATQIATGLGTSLLFLAVDTSNRLFATNSTPTPVAIYDIYPGATGDATYMNGYDNNNIASASTTYNPYGVGAGLSGTLATVNGNTSNAVANTLSIFNPGANGTASSNFVSTQYAGGITGPRELALDGAGNIWIANSGSAGGNYATGATTSGLFILSEFTSTGVALSPGNSSFTTSNATVTGGFQKDAAVAPNGFRGIAVDASGNVWVGSNSNIAAGTNNGTGVMLLVGAAVPVVTPIPAALAAGMTTGNAVSKP